MNKFFPFLTLLVVGLALAACSSSQPDPQPGSINVRTGAFGPSINIGGADGDDDTPVSVRID